MLRCFQTVHPGHIDIHRHHVRLEGLRHGDRFAAVLGLPDYFQLRIGANKLLQNFPHVRGIVHDEHSSSFFGSVHG